ncbi:MAG: DNA translocase FtsK 4TM domain-containing protein [Planctomycetota bacterium]|nr:DNA translocase FtsK 4TM domain-containing protein [Planctomycetota bacterium]
MLEDRNLKLDLFALGLLGATVFLGAALLSYSPADPPSRLLYPPATETANVCGHIGATTSTYIFKGLGLGAFYLLFSLAVLDSILLARRDVSQPVLRLVGWLISLVGMTVLVAMACPQLSPGPVIGSGGYLGATGRAVMEMHFASVGAYILTLSLIFSGLLLCTDYLLLRMFALTVGVPVRGMGRGAMRVFSSYTGVLWGKGTASCEDDEEYEYEYEYEEEDEGEYAIKIAGRTSEEGGKEAEDGKEEGKESDGADAGQSGGKAALKDTLRIRKPKKTGRDEVLENLDDTAAAGASNYELPSIDLLLEGEAFDFDEHEKDVREKAKILETTFGHFGFKVRVVEIQTGPVIAQFEIALEAGLRLSRITSLADDLAIALRVPSVRIVSPIPGKNTVGVEVPNASRQVVRLREVMEECDGKTRKMRIPIFLGKDVSGNSMVADLASLPHLLIAGRTGTGKSVCLNSMIVSMLMTRRPDEVRMLMIDPKMVELSPYRQLPHLMHPVVTDMKKAEAILAWAVDKMEERYQLLARAGVRHVTGYNQLGKEELRRRMQPEDDEEWQQIPKHLPFIVIVADEMADLMMTSAKEVETHIIRLAQKSRAVGIHLVLATQKPTVDVITGLIKSNLPARIAFQVASRVDSRVVLDEMGADRLLGNGDMLFLWPGTSTLIRGQGTFLCDDEINKVIDAVATSEPQFVKELVQLKTVKPGEEGQSFSSRDELYESAVDIVVREGRGSVSLLQRSLGIGYGRGARLIDYMAEDGFVGPYNGSQAREVLISLEDWNAMSGQDVEVEKAGPPTPPKRNNRIQIEHEPEPQAEDAGRTESLEPLSYTDEADTVVATVDGPYDDHYDDGPYNGGPPFATGAHGTASRSTVTFDTSDEEEEELEDEELEDEELEDGEEWEEEEDGEYVEDADDEEEEEEEDNEDEWEEEEEDPDEDDDGDEEVEYEYEYEEEEEKDEKA